MGFERHHQDNVVGAQLDWWALTNVKMDRLAKLHWQQLSDAPNALVEVWQGPFPMEGWSMWHSGIKITSLDRIKLCELLLAHHTINCWIKHKRISASAVSKVDWKVLKKTMKKLRPGRRRWVTKHASDNCGVGVTLVKWGCQVDPMCSI